MRLINIGFGSAVSEGRIIAVERADALRQRRVLDQIALGGHGFHAAVHMTGGQVHMADGFAVHVKMEIDRFLKSHMDGPQRHAESLRAHALSPLPARMRSHKSVVQAPFIMTDSGTA